MLVFRDVYHSPLWTIQYWSPTRYRAKQVSEESWDIMEDHGTGSTIRTLLHAKINPKDCCWYCPLVIQAFSNFLKGCFKWWQGKPRGSINSTMMKPQQSTAFQRLQEPVDLTEDDPGDGAPDGKSLQKTGSRGFLVGIKENWPQSLLCLLDI